MGTCLVRGAEAGLRAGPNQTRVPDRASYEHKYLLIWLVVWYRSLLRFPVPMGCESASSLSSNAVKNLSKVQNTCSCSPERDSQSSRPRSSSQQIRCDATDDVPMFRFRRLTYCKKSDGVDMKGRKILR